jgi:hypothetical protein
MAGHLVACLSLREWWRHFLANGHHMRAARVKAAAGRRIERAWNIADDVFAFAA